MKWSVQSKYSTLVLKKKNSTAQKLEPINEIYFQYIKIAFIFLDWSENFKKYESWNWECGVGVRVGYLLKLKWEYRIGIIIQFMYLLFFWIGSK